MFRSIIEQLIQRPRLVLATSPAAVPTTRKVHAGCCTSICNPSGSLPAQRARFFSSPSIPDHTLPESGVIVPYTVSVIGAPTAWGQPLGGVDTAPAALRDAGLRSTITDQGWRLVDRGNAYIPRPLHTDPPGAGRNSFAIGRGCENISNMTKAAGAFYYIHLK